jgi:hypothetical protein
MVDPETPATSVRHIQIMNTITLSWEDWRAVIAVLRAKQLPYIREHADHVERFSISTLQIKRW